MENKVEVYVLLDLTKTLLRFDVKWKSHMATDLLNMLFKVGKLLSLAGSTDVESRKGKLGWSPSMAY